MKINLLHNTMGKTQFNKSDNSNIQFKGNLISFLPGKLEKLGKDFIDHFSTNKNVKDFPFDTVIFKKGQNIVMDTIITTPKGNFKEIITKMPLSFINSKDDAQLYNMWQQNHNTAALNMIA